jgi:hypothetical protein
MPVEEQIVAVLKAAESGQKVTDLCRSTGRRRLLLRHWPRQPRGQPIACLRDSLTMGLRCGQMKVPLAECPPWVLGDLGDAYCSPCLSAAWSSCHARRRAFRMGACPNRPACVGRRSCCVSFSGVVRLSQKPARESPRKPPSRHLLTDPHGTPPLGSVRSNVYGPGINAARPAGECDARTTISVAAMEWARTACRASASATPASTSTLTTMTSDCDEPQLSGGL